MPTDPFSRCCEQCLHLRLVSQLHCMARLAWGGCRSGGVCGRDVCVCGGHVCVRWFGARRAKSSRQVECVGWRAGSVSALCERRTNATQRSERGAAFFLPRLHSFFRCILHSFTPPPPAFSIHHLLRIQATSLAANTVQRGAASPPHPPSDALSTRPRLSNALSPPSATPCRITSWSSTPRDLLHRTRWR